MSQTQVHGKSVSGDRSAFGLGIKELGMNPAYGWKRSRLNRCQQKFLKGVSFKETALKNKKMRQLPWTLPVEAPHALNSESGEFRNK